MYWGSGGRCGQKQGEPVEHAVSDYVASGGREPERLRAAHEQERWGGSRPGWRYTCVVAWLDVYAHGDRIKIDAFKADRKRVRFESLPAPFRSGERVGGDMVVTERSVDRLALDMRERIVRAAEQARPGGWADMGAYDAVAEFVDWRALFRMG